MGYLVQVNSGIPGATAEIRAPGGGLWGLVSDASVVRGGTAGLEAARVIARPGFLVDVEEPDRPDPRTWGPAGWQALVEAIDRAAQEDGPTLLIRPAAGHVVSDAPSCARALRVAQERWNGVDVRVGVALDAAGMLTAGMAAHAEDYVVRILQMTAGLAGVEAVFATNVVVEGEGCSAGPLTRGVIPADRLAACLRECVPPGTPLILLGDDVEEQAGLLMQT